MLRRFFSLLIGGGWALGAIAAEPTAPTKELLRYEQDLLSRNVDPKLLMQPTKIEDSIYNPESGRIFSIKSYWINADKLDAFESASLDPQLRREFKRKFAGAEQRLFLVHPESESFYEALIKDAERGPDFKATATASARTLLVWNPLSEAPAFFGKLSLNKESAGNIRTIPAGEVARSIGTTEILTESRKNLPRSFAWLPETLGLVPKGFSRGGMILREIPAEIREGKARYVPLFSLYAVPSDGSPPLLVEMIKKSGLPAEEFFEHRVIRPFVEDWIDLAVREGIVMEAHAQNVLMGIGEDGLPNGRFLHRDFGGFNIDLEYRKTRGLPGARVLPSVTDVATDYHQAFHQAALDQSLLHYFKGGFVHNVASSLANWQGKWIEDQGLYKSELENLYIRIVEDVFRSKTSIPGAHLTSMSTFVERARGQFLTQDACGVRIRKLLSLDR